MSGRRLASQPAASAALAHARPPRSAKAYLWRNFPFKLRPL